MERALGQSFTEIDLNRLPATLPRLMVEDLEIAENVEMHAAHETVTVEVTNDVFTGVCQETRGQTRTHTQVGCLLTSAMACVASEGNGQSSDNPRRSVH